MPPCALVYDTHAWRPATAGLSVGPVSVGPLNTPMVPILAGAPLTPAVVGDDGAPESGPVVVADEPVFALLPHAARATRQVVTAAICRPRSMSLRVTPSELRR